MRPWPTMSVPLGSMRAGFTTPYLRMLWRSAQPVWGSGNEDFRHTAPAVRSAITEFLAQFLVNPWDSFLISAPVIAAEWRGGGGRGPGLPKRAGEPHNEGGTSPMGPARLVITTINIS